MFIDKLAVGGSFRYELVLHESVLWITFSTNGEISLETKGHRELARKKNGTYFLEQSMARKLWRELSACRKMFHTHSNDFSLYTCTIPIPRGA